MKGIKLGDNVRFWKILKRKYIGRNDRKECEPNKQWVEEICPDKDGIVIGVRTLFDSHVSYWEEYTTCENVNPQKALLVAFDLKRKPVFVPLDGAF